jgi:hypothetical protein
MSVKRWYDTLSATYYVDAASFDALRAELARVKEAGQALADRWDDHMEDFYPIAGMPDTHSVQPVATGWLDSCKQALARWREATGVKP